jgi:DNA-binding CsgD family transcriptional regulator/pimeloyl-ACP methyl ester carboxylesterase
VLRLARSGHRAGMAHTGQAVTLLWMDQEIRFLESEIGPFACAWVGSGPPLVMPCKWIGNVEAQWQEPGFRDFIIALSREHTVVRYDRPDAAVPLADLAPELRVLERVVEAVGAPVCLFGASSGGCAAVALAAERPELVDRVILYGAYADGSRIASPEVQSSLVGLVRANWGLGARALADLFMPDATPGQRDAFARVERRAAPAALAAAWLQVVYELDVEALLGRVVAPTLVLHRRDDRAIPFGLGRELAAGIPGARFVPLDGRDHLPWIGDVGSVLRPTLAFLGAASAPSEAADGSLLSQREREILALVARGLNNAEIAAQLVLSPHTVHRHVANLRRKLRQPSRAAAVAEATRLGLI